MIERQGVDVDFLKHYPVRKWEGASKSEGHLTSRPNREVTTETSVLDDLFLCYLQMTYDSV